MKPDNRTVSRGGTTYTMNTAAIGARPSPDRSVFDSSSAGSRIAIERPAPVPAATRLESLGASPERARQLAHDQAHGWISSAMWEIETRIGELPRDPASAARLFPNGHRHTLSTPKLRAIAAWLSAFADEWAAIEQENVHVAAE